MLHDLLGQGILAKMKSVGIVPALFERFIDDITIVIKSLEAGTKWQAGVLTVDPEKDIKDVEKTEEEITMEDITDIADSVDNMIKFTVDETSE